VNRNSIVNELEAIREANGGILQPEAVVAAASDPNSALHDRFTWDDTEAAHQYRIWEARHLIRLMVTVLPGKEEAPTPLYVSLHSDRKAEGGGYRILTDVLAKRDLREQLLEEALEDLRQLEAKYQQLTELAEVFVASRKVRRQLFAPVAAAREG